MSLGLVSLPTSRATVFRHLYRVTTVDPTIIDDADDGYIEGSRWVNTATGEEWVCLDNSSGSAIWASTTAGGGGGGPAALGGDLGGTTSNGYVKTVRGLTSTLTYDGNGRLTAFTTAAGTKTMTYDGDGKLTSIAGTGIYRSKTFTYSGSQLTSVAVS